MELGRRSNFALTSETKVRCSDYAGADELLSLELSISRVRHLAAFACSIAAFGLMMASSQRQGADAGTLTDDQRISRTCGKTKTRCRCAVVNNDACQCWEHGELGCC